MKQWCRRDANRRILYERSREKIELNLSETTEDSPAIIAVAMFGIEKWTGTHGALSVLEGSFQGWTDLRRALNYKGLRAIIHRVLFDLDTRRPKQPRGSIDDATFSLAHAITTRDTIIAESAGRILAVSLEDGGLIGAGSSPIDHFMHAIWSGDPPLFSSNPEARLAKFGPYADFFKTPTDDDHVARAVQSALDYHMDHIEYREDDCVGLDLQPYNLFPVEILSVKRVFEQRGLEWPEIRHPLLETKLADVPEEPPAFSDPLLDQCREFVKRLEEN